MIIKRGGSQFTAHKKLLAIKPRSSFYNFLLKSKHKLYYWKGIEITYWETHYLMHDKDPAEIGRFLTTRPCL